MWGNSGWVQKNGWYRNAVTGGGFTPTSTQSANFLTRVAAVTGVGAPTYGLSTNERNAVDALITGLVTDLGGNTSLSTWPIYEGLYALKTISAAVAALNLVSSSFTLVTHGSPTFVSDVGYTGAAASYLDTQFNPTAGTKYLQSDAHIFSYMQSGVSADVGAAFGSNGTQLTNARIYPYFGGQAFVQINGSNSGGYSNPAVSNAKFFAVSRVPATGAADSQGYADTATNGLDAWPSAAPTGTALVLLADDTSGGNHCTAPVALSGFGGGISPTQSGLIKVRLDTYNASVP